MTTLSIRYERHAQRRDTEANWAAANPVLAAGEIGAVTDSGLPWPTKIGDGSTAWLSLPYSTEQFAAATGTNTITATFDPVPVLYDGMEVRLRAAGANTGAVTFNPNSLGALAVTKFGGTALVAGDIVAAGHELRLRYRSSVPRWELMNPAPKLADGDYGDVSVGSGGTTLTVDNDAVTYAKMQNVSAASKLLGRGDSGSGDPQEIALGSGLTMTGTTLSASGGSGAMTYVGGTTVAGSAATTINVTGLNLSTDGRYFIEILGKNATASNSQYSIEFNGDTTSTNYDRVYSVVTTTTTVSRGNDFFNAQMTASDGAYTTAWLGNDGDGKPTFQFNAREGSTTSVQQRHGFVKWRTASNVTSVLVRGSVATSFAVGSFVKIWKIS